MVSWAFFLKYLVILDFLYNQITLIKAKYYMFPLNMEYYNYIEFKYLVAVI